MKEWTMVLTSWMQKQCPPIYIDQQQIPQGTSVKYLSMHLDSKLTLRLLMSYIYGAPSKARNANVVYIWTYVWQR